MSGSVDCRRLPISIAVGFAAIVDLTCELPFDPRGRTYVNLPVLDLTLPDRDTLRAAARRSSGLRATAACSSAVRWACRAAQRPVAGWLRRHGPGARCGSGIRARSRGPVPKSCSATRTAHESPRWKIGRGGCVR
jgi:hypothetical protein